MKRPKRINIWKGQHLIGGSCSIAASITVEIGKTGVVLAWENCRVVVNKRHW